MHWQLEAAFRCKTEAEDSGKLAAALEAVRKVEDNEAESGKNAADDIAAIKAKFKTLLSEALKSGTLATRVVLLKQPGKAGNAASYWTSGAFGVGCCACCLCRFQPLRKENRHERWSS